MRATKHNGRYNKISGKKVAFSPLHNDRNFDLSKAKHIDPSKTQDNKIWYLDEMYLDFERPKSIDDQEEQFYREHFINHLCRQNDKHIKARHKDRVRTMKDYRLNVKTCPEEEILQVGKYGKDSIPADKLEDILIDFVIWHGKQYPQSVILNAVLHVDEPNTADHVHMRRVWIAEDENGDEIVSQNKALEQMGIPLPDPSKPIGRYNNRKMTYTKDCRNKFVEIVQSYGYELELEPLEPSKTGLSHAEYIKQEVEHKAKQTQTELSYRELDLSHRETIQAEQENILKHRVSMLEKEKQEFESEKQNEREKLAVEKQKLAFEKANLDQIVKYRVAKHMDRQRQAEAINDNIKSPDKSRELPFDLEGLH